VHNYQVAYETLFDQLAARGIDVEGVKAKLKQQHIETPSWGYGNSGTRFKTFAWSGAARNVHEKIADAAYVHRLSGIAPSVALHIPWDKTGDWDALKQYAEEQGISIGAINPNVFQDDAYKFGSLCSPDGKVHEMALAHLAECCDIMGKTGSDILSLWFADGTNYAGQDSIRRRKRTDLPDWGTSYAMCLKLGSQAQVLVDTGHHAPGTNIAYIVAFLLDEGRLGGFHFNARKYADDDLIVGSVNPYEVFTIYTELVSAGELADNVAYMIDQSHNIEPKLEAMLLSVLNCQVAYAKALIVNYDELDAAQRAGDILLAHRTLSEAYETDVRPLLAQVHQEMGCPADPIAALRTDDYSQRIAEKRGADSSGSGYEGA
jgi:L-rhamnose isomerase/sugar isomerase